MQTAGAVQTAGAARGARAVKGAGEAQGAGAERGQAGQSPAEALQLETVRQPGASAAGCWDLLGGTPGAEGALQSRDGVRGWGELPYREVFGGLSLEGSWEWGCGLGGMLSGTPRRTPLDYKFGGSPWVLSGGGGKKCFCIWG